MDNASVNIRDELLSLGEWSPRDEFMGAPVYRNGDQVMVTVPRLHLYCDDLDLAVKDCLGITPNDIVFLSRHKAASGQRSLTVHPIGNWGKAEFGGRDGELVASAPHLMTSLLRQLGSEAAKLSYEVTYEATHHGPYLGTPTMFIEIGSSEETWGDRDAAGAIARSITNVRVTEGPVVMGIGGGHYAPRFTEVALGKKVSIGHMLPNYAFDPSDLEDLGKKVKKGMECSGARSAYIHRKSMKRSEATAVAELVNDLGFSTVDSSDLDDLNGPVE